MASQNLVLLVGASGNIGGRIAAALAAKEGVALRTLARSWNAQDSAKRTQTERFKSLGAELVEGDLSDPASLERACAGVHTVLSAVNGDKEVTLTGQLNLLAAAKKAGVSVFMPSDYSFDYNKIQVGDNYNYDARIEVARAVRASGLGYIFPMSGAFMEVFLAPFFNVFDFQKGAVQYWGDGDAEFDLTAMEDTAKYAAEAVVDPRALNTDFQFAGEVTSINKIVADYETISGRKMAVQRRGTTDELKAWIEGEKAKAPDPFVPGPFPNPYMFAQYEWGMVSGKGKLDHLVNDRYPQIQPKTVRQYLQEMLSR